MKDKSIEPDWTAEDTRAQRDCANPARRKTFKVMACAALVAAAGIQPALAEDDAPKVGDWLVKDGDEAKTPLTSADIKLEKKQLIVYPQDPKSNKLRDESRLNRIIVIKLDPKDGTVVAKIQLSKQDPAPHGLDIDRNGVLWYCDAGSSWVCKLV